MRRFLSLILFVALCALTSGAQQAGTLPSGGGTASQAVAPNQNAIYVSPNCGTQTNCFPIHTDAHFVTDAVTTGSSAIVTSATANFTGTDLQGRPIAKTGQVAYVLNSSTGAPVCPASQATLTILSIDSATQIHLSGNCGSPLTGATLAWGDDDTTDINTAWASAVNNCAPLELSSGYSLISSAVMIASLVSPCDGTGPRYAAPKISGVNETTDFIIVAPSMNWTSCTGGMSGAACIGGQKSTAIKELTITGLGLTGFSAGTKNLVEENDGSTLSRVDIEQIGQSATSGLTCLLNESSTSGNYVGGVFNCGQAGTVINPINGPSSSFGFYYGPAGVDTLEVSNTNCTAPLCGQVGINSIYIASNSTNPAIKVDTGAVVTDLQPLIKTSYVETAGTYNIANGSLPFGVQVDSGGVFTSHGTTLGQGGLSASINCLTGSKSYDLGANIFNPGSGQPNCAGLLFGSASITGATQTTANVALTSGWGTSPSVSAASGNSQRESFTITVGTTPSANPVTTVTFPTPFLATPICSVKDSGGTNPFLNATMGTVTKTTAAVDVVGTPTGADTITFVLDCSN